MDRKIYVSKLVNDARNPLTPCYDLNECDESVSSFSRRMLNVIPKK